MEKEPILSGGIDTLNTIKEHVLELNGCKEKKQELDVKESQLEQLIENKEKIINDEITNTLKKRKEEVVVTINEQIEETKSRFKKAKAKKDKHKNAKISERIKTETAELEEENTKLKQMSKTLFKQSHISRIFNTKLYYALFSPKYFLEMLTVIATLLIVFLALPCGLYYYFTPEKKTVYFAIIYFLTVVVVLGFYIFIYKISKGKHREDIMRGRAWRNEIHANHKKINAISKSIIKDKDESVYGLDKLNKELDKLARSIEELENQKKETLNNFERKTKIVISTEIQARYENELKKLRNEYEDTNKVINEYADKIKEMSLDMANHYEAYLGKEFLTIEKLDALAQLMNTRNIATISAALALLSKEEN